MSVLYVLDQSACVSVVRNRLVVRKGRTQLSSVRLEDCLQVVLLGNPQITTQAMKAALRQGVEVLLLTRGGRFVGRIAGGLSGNVTLRQAQYHVLHDGERVLALARRYVEGKIRNGRRLLLRYQRQLRDERVAAALSRTRVALGRLEECGDLDELRGVEGLASREFFAGFGRLIRAEGILFERRLRRPPPDPVNILLSFGYTLLAGLIHGMVEQAGLDPYLGALHAPAVGRPSLVLDLMEEFRPVIVDAAVLRALNTGAIRAADFIYLQQDEITDVEDEWEREDLEQDPDADPATIQRKVLLTDLGKKKWLTAFERRLAESTTYPRLEATFTYRQIIREQVYLLARHLREAAEYEPFVQRG